MESRKEQYKHIPSSSNLRERKRVERDELRKDRREELITSKRARHSLSESADDDISSDQIVEAAQKLMKKKEVRVKTLKFLRNGFTQGTALIDAFLGVDGAMSCLVGLLTGSDTEIQLLSSWCLTNMAAGTDSHAQIVIKQTAPYLVTFLSSAAPALQDQCAWTIGNLAGGSDECRKILISQGVIHNLVPLLESTSKNVVKSSAFALSNLAKDAQANQLMLELKTLEKLEKLLSTSQDDEDIMTEAMWILTYLSSVHQDHENLMKKSNLFSGIISLLIRSSKSKELNVQMITPVLRCIGNFVCDVPTELILKHLVDPEVYSAFMKMLESGIIHLQKEGLWALSNIAAHLELSKAIVSTTGLLSSIINHLNSIFSVRFEAAYCLCTIAQHGEEFAKEIFNAHCMTYLVPLLKAHDTELVSMILSLLLMIMKACGNEAVRNFEENKGFEAVEVLEYNENETISKKTTMMFEDFIYKYLEPEEENI